MQWSVKPWVEPPNHGWVFIVYKKFEKKHVLLEWVRWKDLNAMHHHRAFTTGCLTVVFFDKKGNPL